MRTRVAAIALAFAAVLGGAGSAFADGGVVGGATGPSAAPSVSKPPQGSSGGAGAGAMPTASPSRSRTSPPSPVASASASASQVGTVPSGAPNTGVPPVAAQAGTDGTTLGAEIGGAVLLAGAGAFALRRRAKARG